MLPDFMRGYKTMSLCIVLYIICFYRYILFQIAR